MRKYQEMKSYLESMCVRSVSSRLILEYIQVGNREGTGNPLQYCCLEHPMDRGAWEAAVCGVAKSRTQLSDFTFTFHFHALERKWQPSPVFLPGESQGRGSLVGCRIWGRTELDMTEATEQQEQQQQLGNDLCLCYLSTRNCSGNCRHH